MKKTLFAMLALATIMPAMAENWTLGFAYSNPYENFTDYTKYSLYLMEKGNSDITSVKTMLEGKTFSEFTTTIASGDSFAFTDYNSDLNQLCMPFPAPAGTEFPTTLDGNNIWGVCVLQDTDVVRFQVLQVEGVDPGFGKIFYDTDIVAGSGYTSFSSGSVPEPATATLSLLALAGLATRRKRK